MTDPESVESASSVGGSDRWDGITGEMLSRLLPGAIWIFLFWPAVTILTAAWMLGEQPLTSMMKWPVRVTGVTAATGYLLPQIVGCGLVLLAASVVFWSGITRLVGGTSDRFAAWIEPPLLALFLSTGVAMVYPIVLRHPIFMWGRSLPVFLALALLLLLAVVLAGWVGYARSGRRAGAVIFAEASVAIILLSALVTAVPIRPDREGMRESTLLLGLDSLALTQNLSILGTMAEEPGWTWFERPVTPGLFTNSVWPSILMNRRVHETGCYLTFQHPNWDRSSYNMVREAEAAGLETWSFFSDQFTTYVGSIGGFEVDRSGPKGWLQPATVAFKDASILVPVMLPRLPEIPLARSPRNQSGTFAYDLRREIDDIATAGEGRRRVFVAAHLDYLHQPAYPGLHDLNRDEIVRVLRARVESINDLSIHWQYPMVLGEPLRIYDWKLERLQRVVVEVFRDRGIARPDRGNRVAIFSDHGPRIGISADDFSRRHLYEVPLITYGTVPRDPSIPISLLDLHELIGLPDPSRRAPAPPAVEYTFARTFQEEMVMLRSSTLRSDGEVALNPWIIARFGERLLAFYPHASQPVYVEVPTTPAELDAITGTEAPAE